MLKNRDMTTLNYEQLDPSNDQDVREVARRHCEAPGEWVADHACSEAAVLGTIDTLRDPECCHCVALARCPRNGIVGFHWVQLEIRLDNRLGNALSLWVHPEWRRQGIATHLKTLAERWLRSKDVSEIRTEVYLNNRNMQALNKKLGYETVLVGMSKRLD